MIDDLLDEIEAGPGELSPERRAQVRAVLETVREHAGDDAAAALAEWASQYPSVELAAMRGHAGIEYGVPSGAYPDEAYP